MRTATPGMSVDDGDAEPRRPVAALDVRDVVLDPVFGKRRDALLRTVPIHDLVVRAARADSGYAGFDVRALALAAFDAVIARQGFPDRTTPGQTVDLLAGIAAVQQPAAPASTCTAVAEHVLDGLTNRRERERDFRLHSVVYAAGDRGEILATSVPRPFWLMREQEDGATGQVYLEASADAVNALVGGLDIPIEDQQTALELILERQLARGDLDNAHLSAENARRLTVAFIAQTNELLAETERFLPGTDWRIAAPQLLDAAMAHLSECLKREGRLVEHVAAGGDTGTGHDSQALQRARVSRRLTKLLNESMRLHTALMERLMGARRRFLDAQDAQMFRPSITIIELDLLTDLLVPTLALHVRDALAVSGEYLRSLVGPTSPPLLDWRDFVGALLVPKGTADGPADSDDGPLEFRPDPPPLVTTELVTLTRDLLDRIPLPARLSTLIAACPQPVGNAAVASDLIVTAALRGYDNATRDANAIDPDVAWITRPEAGDWDSPQATIRPRGSTATPVPIQPLDVLGPDAACYSDGLVLGGAGWDGDDLIVCVDPDQLDALLLGQVPVPPPTELPERPLRGNA